MERWGWRGLKYDGNWKQAENGQRPSGMEGVCIGSHGPQRTVAFEEEEEKYKENNNNNKKNCLVDVGLC